MFACRDSSLTRKRTPLGTYRRPMTRVLGRYSWGGRVLVSEVPLYHMYMQLCCTTMGCKSFLTVQGRGLPPALHFTTQHPPAHSSPLQPHPPPPPTPHPPAHPRHPSPLNPLRGAAALSQMYRPLPDAPRWFPWVHPTLRATPLPTPSLDACTSTGLSDLIRTSSYDTHSAQLKLLINTRLNENYCPPGSFESW